MPRVLVVGGGGREHALVKALARSPQKPELFVAPGNAGIGRDATLVDLAVTDLEGLVRFATEQKVDLVVVGPEAPLVLGLVDRLKAANIPAFGPTRAAAELEGSKAFAKVVMREAGVPTARGEAFDDEASAAQFVRNLRGRAVVKADGLAAGKGVVVADDEGQALDALREFFAGSLGSAGRRVVVEERLDGEELSVLAICDEERLVLLPSAQDHKRVFDGDRGPNTGGMGAYSPAPRATPSLLASVEATCLRPVLAVMKKRGTPFSGVLYAGLMLTDQGPKVLEYNARFGDPETQVILPRLNEDLYALFLEVASSRLRERPLKTMSGAALTVVLAAEHYPAEPTKGDVIEGLETVEGRTDVTVYHAASKRAGDHLVTAGGRVLTVTGLGVDLPEAQRRAYEVIGPVHFRGMHYRRDIGHRALGPREG